MSSYKVNEIFAGVQAEGGNAGRAAVFVRLSGCNLRCPWCDTPRHNDGVVMSREELESAVQALYRPGMMILFTGGEPTLQLQEEEELFPGTFRAIETNGTRAVPTWIDYVACSPKSDLDFADTALLRRIHPSELKLVFEPGREEYLLRLEKTAPCPLFLQPLESGGKMNITETIDFLLAHPRYRLSLQYHKLIGIR